MKVFLDTDEMASSVEKIDMYRKEEDLEFEKIKTTLENINEYYVTKNSSGLINIKDELNNKMNVLSKIHSNNVFVLNTKIQQHIDLKNKNMSLLSESNFKGN